MSVTTPPLRRRRRPRRGSVERPVDGRLYRVAFLAVVLPLLIAAFTLVQPRLAAAPTGLPLKFNTDQALRLTQELAGTIPNREPGTPGASKAADWFRSEVAPFGLHTRTDTWNAAIPGLGTVALQNISLEVPGRSPDTIVVMAHRDDTGIAPGADDNASGTAALITLAEDYAQPTGTTTCQPGVSACPTTAAAVQATHTLIFLSTDAGAFGGLGALRAAKTLGSHVVAVINLDAIAGAGPPRMEISGDLPRSPSASLVQTASAQILDNTGVRPQHAGVLGQLIDLGFPFALYEQAPFVARGIPAVTLTTSGDRPREPLGDTIQLLHKRRLGQMGLAAKALLRSLDQGADLARGTTSYLWVGNRFVRGWAIELVLIALFVPFVVGAVDLFAYCRRRAIPLGPAVRSLGSRLGFVAYASIVFLFFGWLGAWPSGPSRPPNPALASSGNWPVLTLLGFGAIGAAGWLLTRRSRAPQRRVTADEELAGHAVALLALVVLGLLVIATNPFALLFALPAFHIWLWLPVLRSRPLLIRLAAFSAGLIGPGLVLISLASRFGLGLDAPWYLVELVTVGYVTFTPVLIALAGAAAAAQLAAISARRYTPYPSREERGPRGPIRDGVRTVVVGLRSRRAEPGSA